ncbi:MAG TPA: tetratricopeptide repeat protein [Anditalea sp.]|nr:tetratricopeptide repeat protein [Anditalea sp.]
MKIRNSLLKVFLGIGIIGLMSVNDVFAQDKLSKKARKEQEKNAQADRLFVEGQKFLMLEEYEKAYFYFEKAHKYKPTEPAINFKMAEILARANEPEKALDYGLKAVDGDPSNKYYHLLIAEVYSNQNKPKKAAEILQSLMNNSEENQQYILELASLYLTAQDFDNALKALDRAEEYYGVVEQLTVQKQRIYLRKNNLEAAINEGRKLVDAHPGQSSYVLSLVEIFYNNGRSEEAMDLVLDALKNYPNQPELHMAAYSLLKDSGETQKSREYLFMAFENPDLDGEVKAKAFNEILQEIKSEERDQVLNRLGELMKEHNATDPNVLIVLGDKEMADGQKDAALQYYKKSLDIMPANDQVLQRVITLKFEENKNFEEVERYTVMGVDEFPEKPEFWFFDGTAKLAQKKHAEAKESLEKAENLNNGANKQISLLVYGQLGDAYHGLGEYDKSYEFYERGLKINPSDEHILNNYAYFLSLKKKDLDKAKKMSGRLVEKFPTNATYLDTHAWVLFQLGEYDRAKEYMTQAIAYENEPSGVMYEHLGDIYFKLGNKSEALKYWQKAEGGEEVSDYLAQKIKDRKYYE